MAQMQSIPALLIKNVTVILQDRLLNNAAVFCQKGKIVWVGAIRSPHYRKIRDTTPVEIIEGANHYLSPGFIDLHFHGVHTYLTEDGPDQLAAICRILPVYGVTGFLPTLSPRPDTQYLELLSSLARSKPPGTSIYGFHLEGPFLTLSGALKLDTSVRLDAGCVSKLVKAVQPHRAIFSVSPEFSMITDLIPLMAEKNTPVFITHTQATVGQTQAAIKAGVCHATHFYDVFPCPPVTDEGVRPCGAVEAVLADPRVSVDFVLDGEHVDPVAVKMALHAKGPDRVCLITDSNLGAGLEPGLYKGVGDTEIEFAYEGAPARMTENTSQPGCLAGSGLTMDRAVRNATRMAKIDLPLAVRMASLNPAQVLGLSHRKGAIKEGYDADLVLLDKDLHVEATWIMGKIFNNQ
jgi:N-acetylglucosamine-6-phosphate deacetylase